jgi:hypothetical protein
MKIKANSNLIHGQSGQSLLESAITLPFIIYMLFNAINAGYFWAVSLKLATAPRQGVEYSIMGTSSTVQQQTPPVGGVTTLIYANASNSIGSSAATTPLRACTMNQGLVSNGSYLVPNCTTPNGGSFTAYTQYADPEAPPSSGGAGLILNQVDIIYTVNPLISGPFLVVGSKPITLHKVVVMRAIGA